MANPREGPNPLRPYYIPPSIGFPPETQNAGGPGRGAGQNGSTSYASSARDMFSDIDYSDYVSEGSQSTVDMIKQMLDDAMYKYMSVLIAQPFDVAKTILQVRSQALADPSVPPFSPRNGRKETADFVESRYSDVRSHSTLPVLSHANFLDSILQTIQTQTSLHISLPMRHQQHPIPPQPVHGAMPPIVLVTSCPPRMTRLALTNLL